MRRIFVGLVGLAVCAWLGAVAPVAMARHHVLRVGTYHGIRGQYKSIQAAVNHARAGDFILVAPGDYKTHHSRAPKGFSNRQAAVLITKRNLTLRGMNRNRVVIDGTRKGAKCNALKRDQNFGPKSKGGPLGLNGVLVWKARNVKVENLTTCNFLSGAGDAGNGIWWNGGDESGKIGGWRYYGAYLTSTSRYYDAKNSSNAAAYGIFSSNWDGGSWYKDYASNFNDSGFYIGACQQVCNQTMSHVWAEWNALGYSGSNSGGSLVTKYSQFNNNEDGFDTNSQNGDNPPPQNGQCPNGGISPITHTKSCWVFEHNYVHDNNNPNVPSSGLAAAGPVGTGMSLSGGRNDTVMNNTFARNNAWGTIFVPFPDSGPPCTGGTAGPGGQPACLYDEWDDALLNNTYYNNGSYGNQTNGDFGWVNTEPDPTSCFSGNRDTKGTLTATPSDAQTLHTACNGTPFDSSTTEPQTDTFLAEVGCDSTLYTSAGKLPCPPGSNYPRRTHVVMHPLPKHLQSMPHPCKGVPRNPWCRASKKK